MDTEQQTFYSRIPPIYHITDITRMDHYYDVPADWVITMTDVRGSTKAIEQGRYRQVNAVAAAAIAAMLNAVQGVDIPFVFGGDGATILVPPHKLQEATEALLATRDLARDGFDLELRIGIIPVSDVLEAGYRVRVARLYMSDNFQQAIFIGGGLTYAERLLKDEGRGTVPEIEHYQASFHGFECRWNEIPTTHEETVSLIVMATDENRDNHNLIYHDVLQNVERIFGDSRKRHPISVGNLHLAMNPNKMRIEATVRHRDTSLRRRLKLLWGSIKVQIAMRFNIGQWPQYKQFLVESTDHEKFDDTLRMIISGTSEQRQALRDYLEEKHRAGQLVYGTHISEHTLVTCIVYDYFGRQVHFVDGARGGYAFAARELKSQLAALKGKINSSG